MTIYSFWIYDKHCNCIYSREYVHHSAGSGSINSRNNDNYSKLLFGIFFSARKISNSLVAGDRSDNSDPLLKSDSLNTVNRALSFSTLNYKCHMFETMTGLKLALMTDPDCRDLNTELNGLYSSVYRQKVVQNPACQVDFREGESIENSQFIEAVDRFWQSLPEFK